MHKQFVNCLDGWYNRKKRGDFMKPTKEELLEAKRQIDSTIHKLKESVKTMEAKENAAKLKSQITLAKRRAKAFEIAVTLIEKALQ